MSNYVVFKIITIGGVEDDISPIVTENNNAFMKLSREMDNLYGINFEQVDSSHPYHKSERLSDDGDRKITDLYYEAKVFNRTGSEIITNAYVKARICDDFRAVNEALAEFDC